MINRLCKGVLSLLVLCSACTNSTQDAKVSNKATLDSTTQLEAAMKTETECQFIRLFPDGSLLIKFEDREERVEIYGIEAIQPLPELYSEMISHRIPKLGRPLRCAVQSKDSTGQIQAKLFYYGWQDKSGDVWIDLAIALLDEGLVRVAAGDFPEREEYLQHEQKARENQRGISWEK